MIVGYAHMVDVYSAFLLGVLDNGEDLYAYVPKGWENKFAGDVILRLLKTVYGLKQAANCFYRLLVSVMHSLSFRKKCADPYLNHRWDEGNGLMIWASRCDDLLAVGRKKQAVLEEVEGIKGAFNVDDVGVLEDYLGCKLEFDWDNRSCRLTQPVHI